MGTRHSAPIPGNRRNVLGAKIREIRLAKAISSTDLVARLQILGWQISRETYSYIESGQRVLGDAELLLILKVLNARLRDLE